MISLKDRIKRLGLTCIVNEKRYIYGHEYVDLGLPSGLRWAKCNLGAKEETDFGDYYQFGQVEPYEKTWEKHIPLENDTVDKVWRNRWRMPTQADFQELINNTISKWLIINGVGGYKFISKTDSSKYIFFPAAGYWSNGSQNDVGSSGNYWGSSPNGSNSACGLYFDNGYKVVYNDSRKNGYSVRPVVG
jgi:uncharacterized protein (TIGR02145 family)